MAAYSHTARKMRITAINKFQHLGRRIDRKGRLLFKTPLALEENIGAEKETRQNPSTAQNGGGGG